MFYILNESRVAGVSGAIDFYWSLETLTEYIEAIDVLNQEFRAYDSLGNVISLVATSEFGPIKATTESSQSGKEELASVLRGFLQWAAGEGRFGIDKDQVLLATELHELVELVPSSLIE